MDSSSKNFPTSISNYKYASRWYESLWTSIIVNCAGQTREAERIVMHKDYNQGSAFANDIALIKLDEPFWINNVSKHFLTLSPTFSRWSTTCVYHRQAGNQKIIKLVWFPVGDCTTVMLERNSEHPKIEKSSKTLEWHWLDITEKKNANVSSVSFQKLSL